MKNLFIEAGSERIKIKRELEDQETGTKQKELLEKQKFQIEEQQNKTLSLIGRLVRLEEEVQRAERKEQERLIIEKLRVINKIEEVLAEKKEYLERDLEEIEEQDFSEDFDYKQKKLM